MPDGEVFQTVGVTTEKRSCTVCLQIKMRNHLKSLVDEKDNLKC